MLKTYVTCDETIRCGSVEHYYHFLWGYLLPACHYLIEHSAARTKEKDRTTAWRSRLGEFVRGLRKSTGLDQHYVFRSCGPLMDPLIEEVLAAFECRVSIIDKTAHARYDGPHRVYPARWDVWLNRVWFKLGDAATYPGTHLTQPEHFLKVRRRLLDLFLSPDTETHAPNKESPYLLLKRASEHPFYGSGGSAEIPTYGTGRRTLHGLEAGQDFLTRHGIPCVIFEAGRHSLREQINAFHHCRGIIAMRGAEVANMIWMQPRSQVILYNPSESMPIGSPSRAFAEFFDLDYAEIDIGATMHPTLNAPELLAMLSNR